MKINYFYLVLCLVFTGAAFHAETATAASGAAATAFISKIDGEGVAKVRRKMGLESVAGIKQELFAGDKITTDSKSVVEIMLADGTLVRVGLNSEYKMESVEKKNGIFTWVFGLAKGSIRALVEKNPKKGMVKFRVNTPVGTMGVRGTELVLEHNEKRKRTTLYTIEGKVEFGKTNCFAKRQCIEVKTGEMASIGAEDKALPVAKPAGADSVLLVPNAQRETGEAGNASKDKEAGGASLAGDSASEEERLARASLFTDVRNAESLAEKLGRGLSVESKGEVDKMLAEASAAMANVQDSLLGRTKAQRQAVHDSIANGSYESKLKLAEKFDDLAGAAGTGSGKDRAAENLSGSLAGKKIALADSILSSQKMKSAMSKQVGVDNALITAKLSEAQEKIKAAQAKSAEQAALSTASATATAMPEETIVAAPDPESTTKKASELAVLLLKKEVVDGIIGEPTVRTVYESYKTYEKCAFSFFGIFCDKELKVDGVWYEVKDKKNSQTETTYIERKGSACYQSVKKCGREMIPCDLSKGKACNPTFKDYACKTVSQQIACPAK